jgi:CheY-specific phosphatase CheX
MAGRSGETAVNGPGRPERRRGRESQNVNSEVISAFTSAASRVLSEEVGSPVEVRNPKVQAGPVQLREVSVVVALASSIEGAIVLGMSADMALKYLSHALGEELIELNDLARSGIGELGNMLAGAASAQFTTIGYPTVIFPPTVLVGGGRVSMMGFPRLVFSIELPYGIGDLQLAAREHR